jgi:S-adenosylmethionine hydrolase
MRCIALLTDFGMRDPYVASMKGVLAGRTEAAVVDLTHDIAPFDVREAAWFLRTVERWWPEGTIFVAVVDPGVGTSRRIVAAERHGRTFLAPDNGLLTFVRDGIRAVSVEATRWFLPAGSTTFHGRDRFAPVAAAIANGLALGELGPPAENLLRLDDLQPSYDERRVTGTIVSIDRFGSLITDIEPERIAFAPFALHAGEVVIDRMERSYGNAAAGPFLIAGSGGTVEVSLANGSAAEVLHLRRGDSIEIVPR